MINEWEGALMVRDAVFLQLSLLTVLVWLAYHLFMVHHRRVWRWATLAVGSSLLLALLVISVVNILTWSPT